MDRMQLRLELLRIASATQRDGNPQSIIGAARAMEIFVGSNPTKTVIALGVVPKKKPGPKAKTK